MANNILMLVCVCPYNSKRGAFYLTRRMLNGCWHLQFKHRVFSHKHSLCLYTRHGVVPSISTILCRGYVLKLVSWFKAHVKDEILTLHKVVNVRVAHGQRSYVKCGIRGNGSRSSQVTEAQSRLLHGLTEKLPRTEQVEPYKWH